MAITNGNSNGNANGTHSASLLENTAVPSILDNKRFQGLQSTYPLNDPHTGKFLVSIHTYTPPWRDCYSR